MYVNICTHSSVIRVSDIFLILDTQLSVQYLSHDIVIGCQKETDIRTNCQVGGVLIKQTSDLEIGQIGKKKLMQET